MRSHNLSLTLLIKELRCLFAGRTLWILLIILSLLTGYSFIQAVNLFSQASQTALQFPALARGMMPLDGIIVPTFGALYLVVTLLFPFVSIRLIGDEKEKGGLKLLLQSPLGLTQIIAVKVVAMVFAWLLMLLPVLSAMGIWLWLGGHIFLPELLNMVAGYTLYALVIIAIAFFSSALTESNATATIVTLAFTLGSWVLDFSAGTQGWLRTLSALSFTAQLRTYERGLFSLSQTSQVLLTALALLAGCVIWLHPGTPFVRKVSYSAVTMASAIVLMLLVAPLRGYADVSEDRRNSFNPADEYALQQMTAPLTITVNLSPQDSRLKDLERNILPVLRHTVPRLNVIYADAGKIGLFGTATDDKYGLIEYEYAGQHDESRSTSAGEILPILHNLAHQSVTAVPMPEYPGYPLVSAPSLAGVWFYGALPALFGILWFWIQVVPKRQGEKKNASTI